MTGQRTRAAVFGRLLILLVLLGTAACASGGRPIVSREAGSGNQIQLTVENQNFKDAVVYALWGAGPRDRLGTVIGNTTQTFEVPYRSGEFRVEVDFIAGDDVVTETIGVFQGDHIQVQIPPNL